MTGAHAVAVVARGRNGPVVSRPVGVLTAGLVVVALAWAVASGIEPLVVVVAAAVPLGLAIGHRWALPILLTAVVVRPLVDDLGMPLATGGIGVGVLGLALLLMIHDARAAALLLPAALPVVVSAVIGYERFGVSALEEGLRLMSLVGVAVVVLVAPTELTRSHAARVVQVAGVVPALVAYYQAATGTGTRISDVLRASGTLSQANPAAFFFSICAVACLVRLAEARTRGTDITLLCLFGGAVLCTGSISGLVTFVVAGVLYVALVHGFWSARSVVAVGSVTLLAALVYVSPIGQGRAAELSMVPGPELPDNSVTWRFNAWATIFGAWQSRPLTGHGLGATLEGNLISNIAHNEYLYVLAEMGVVGMAIVLAGVTLYVAGMLRFKRLGASPLNRAMAFSVLAALALNSVADNPAHHSPSMFVVVLLLAVAWRRAGAERAVAQDRSRVPRPAPASPHESEVPGGA